MIFKKITIIILFFFLLISAFNSIIYSKTFLKIYIEISDKNFYKIFYKSFINYKNFKIVKNPKDSDILICSTLNNVKKCLIFKKPIIAINIYSFEISKIKDSNVIAYFPIDLNLTDILIFLKKNIKKDKKKCILTFYDQFKGKASNSIKKFKVHNIGEVPLMLNRAFKECDIIIGIPDDIVYNHFSIRYILKNTILNGKIFIGFTKEMIDYGALYSFEIDKIKYIKMLKEFLINIDFNKKQKIYFSNLNLFNIYKNEELWNNLK